MLSSRVTGIVRLVAYPALLLGTLAALWFLLYLGASLAWAPYAAAGAGAALVIAAERVIPYRQDWWPSRGDLVDDALYMAVVQLLLPVALAWAVVWVVQLSVHDSPVDLGIWPVTWPIWAQLILKIVTGDFFRYWLHRAAHVWTPLWRLHAVHHEPAKLYTTNVFRFHPVEKALQFVCDSLPFIVAGIGPEVLAYYFVFYAMSGLFQHSNCDIRLGWLNFIVSGPEVHRWHHSRRLGEANANFAHSFVVWDVIFGTYFRPRGRQVDELGLLTRNYPQHFLRQLMAPLYIVPNADSSG